jgi:hypothetical protein
MLFYKYKHQYFKIIATTRSKGLDDFRGFVIDFNTGFIISSCQKVKIPQVQCHLCLKEIQDHYLKNKFIKEMDFFSVDKNNICVKIAENFPSQKMPQMEFGFSEGYEATVYNVELIQEIDGIVHFSNESLFQV